MDEKQNNPYIVCNIFILSSMISVIHDAKENTSSYRV